MLLGERPGLSTSRSAAPVGLTRLAIVTHTRSGVSTRCAPADWQPIDDGMGVDQPIIYVDHDGLLISSPVASPVGGNPSRTWIRREGSSRPAPQGGERAAGGKAVTETQYCQKSYGLGHTRECASSTPRDLCRILGLNKLEAGQITEFRASPEPS
jgi:hypothetical protein